MVQHDANSCRRRSPLAQGVEQSGGEFAPAVSKTGANAPRLPIDRIAAAIRFDLLRRSQPFRSTPLQQLCISNSNPPPAGHDKMESCRAADCVKNRLRLSRAYSPNNVTAPVCAVRLWVAVRLHRRPIGDTYCGFARRDPALCEAKIASKLGLDISNSSSATSVRGTSASNVRSWWTDCTVVVPGIRRKAAQIE
jgi:hypothetical protein